MAGTHVRGEEGALRYVGGPATVLTFRPWLITGSQVDRSQAGGELQLMEGYFVHYIGPSNLPPMPKHVIFVLDTSGRWEVIYVIYVARWREVGGEPPLAKLSTATNCLGVMLMHSVTFHRKS